MMLPAQRPGRIISVLAALLCFGIWYTYQPETILRCEVPILVEQHNEQQPTTDKASTFAGGGAGGAKLVSNGPNAAPVGNFSKIAKVSVATNKLDNENIDRALRTHERHNAIHGYQHFMAKHEAVSKIIEHDNKNRPSGAWTKPAYLLSLMVAELQKEEEDRLEWLFWFDADTVILNQHTPLEVFMPPKWNKELENLHLLIAGNWDGLNSGAFALKVAPWSVSFLSAVLAYPIYESRRQEKDRFRDQSAFQWLLEGSDSPLAGMPMRGKDHWVEVPMRWFNSIPFNNAFALDGKWILTRPMSEETFDKGTTELIDDGHPHVVKPWKVMRGDLAVHFAGTTAADVRDSWLGPWLDRAEAELPEWSNATRKVELEREVKNFYNQAADNLVRARQRFEANGQDPPPEPLPSQKGEEAKHDRPADEENDHQETKVTTETANTDSSKDLERDSESDDDENRSGEQGGENADMSKPESDESEEASEVHG